MKILLFTLLLLSSSSGAKKYYCSNPNSNPELECYCLSFHPELCESEDALPNCCRATEKGTKANGGCHCCAKK